MSKTETTGGDFLFTEVDFERLRADLAEAKDVYLAAKRRYVALERKVEAAEFLFRQIRSNRMADERADAR